MSSETDSESSRPTLAADIFSNISRPERESYRHPSRVSNSCQSCGKVYSTPHHLAAHGYSCDANKRKVDQMLQDSKIYWEMRKRQRVERQAQNLCRQSQIEVQAARGASPIERLAPNEDAPDTPVQDLSPPATSAERAPVNLPTDLDVPVAHRRGMRERRLPKRFRQDDDLPPTPGPAVSQQPVAVPVIQDEDGISEASTAISPPTQRPAVAACSESPVMRSLVLHQSCRSTFGVVKSYSLPFGHKLTHDPEQEMTLEDQSDIPRHKVIKPTYGPFKSKSAFSLADWYWNSTNKSFLDFQKLIAIFKQPNFSLNDVVDVNWRTAFKELGANPEDLADSVDASWMEDDGWTTTPINIDIPFHNQMRVNKGTTTNYCIGQLRHRRIISVIKEKILNREDSRNFHYVPYRASWKPTEQSDEVELYGELYASRAFRSAHEELQKLPSSAFNHNLERVVVAMMLWSDGTQLTNFAPASLWPCYLLFGNESKYRRCQPSERLANQIAYFQKLPDTLYEYLKNRNGGKVPYDGLMAYCVREAFHQQWSILLDDELRNAMQHGIRLLCPDGRERCFYPRIFTYSADYPEKVLVASVRNNGLCPCHRCLVPATGLSKLGAPGDIERNAPRQESEIIDLVNKAREEIINHGYAVDSKSKVEVYLKPQSLVPTKDAFSNFAGHPFDIRQALTVDLMHEFESGAWKKVFIHAIRLLEFFTTKSTTLTAALDERYRATPAFGRDSIRKFSLNVSDMKRKAAHDFANLLQCAIPAFESLLPEPHNTTFMELLYILAEWHALAKLRLHNDFTVSLLEYYTKLLGAQMRRFSQEVCEKTPTKELDKEAQARARRDGKAPGKSTKKAAKLAIFTIKWHFLGDYVSTIRWFGTTDSYSTETGELAHRLPKSWYPRTDKRDFEAQMSQIERRQARLGRIRSENAEPLGVSTSDPPQPEGEIDLGEVEVTATTQRTIDDATLPLVHAPSESSPDRRYVIARNQGSPIDLSLFGETPGWDHDRDIYTKNFVPKLKQHLLPRILEKLGYGTYSVPQSEHCNVVLTGDRIYRHRLLRINYTTYDVRRNEDVIHVDTPQCNVMLLNRAYGPETWSSEHAYIYGKCLGVYHANVSFVGCLPDGTRCYREHRLDFVWIHWYEHIASESPLALDRLSFVPLDAPSAVGFVDPGDILRGVHIVPQFSLGEADVQIRSKWASSPQKLYKSYYVNRFADRDLFMRYQYGMSVGHTYMHRGSFPPPKVLRIPEDFNYWVDGDGLGEPEGDSAESELGDNADEEEDPDSAGISSLRHATHEMDEREANFYLEMYDGT